MIECRKIFFGDAVLSKSGVVPHLLPGIGLGSLMPPVLNFAPPPHPLDAAVQEPVL